MRSTYNHTYTQILRKNFGLIHILDIEILSFDQREYKYITCEWASPHVCCRSKSRTLSKRSFVIVVEFAVFFVMIITIDSYFSCPIQLLVFVFVFYFYLFHSAIYLFFFLFVILDN